MTIVVPLLLLAPLLLVPLGYRLIGLAAQGSEPPVRLRMAAFPAAIVLAVAYTQPQGWVAAALALPWLAVTGLVALVAGVRFLRDPARFRPGPRHAVDAAVAFLAIGASFAVTDRLGARPFGFDPTIILLTAVHFHFAGFVLPLAGALTYRRRPARWLEIALGLVVVGIPTTAVGFFGLPIVNWSGSMLVATGGFGIGAATLLSAGGSVSRVARGLLVLAGASLLVAMPLAAIYATGTLTGTAWLDMSTMARIHGSLNALGFAVPVIVAWSLERRALRDRRDPADPLDVMGFNAAAFILGPTVAIAGAVVGLQLAMPLRGLVLIGAAMAAILSAAAIIAVVWVFAWTARRRWAWVADTARSPRRWLNVTTGFDDSSAWLLDRFPTADGATLDLFDASRDQERPLLRARHRFTPAAASVPPDDIGLSVASGAYDAVFLLMSAHEAHGSDRAVLFDSATRALAPGGRVILVEHLHDLANTLAFGPGAQHFQTEATWSSTAQAAGLRLVSQVRHSPFVHGYVFERA